ncbi:MAG TPA: hypothetical protein VGK59_11005 [Ohtaekwangia sp.]
MTHNVPVVTETLLLNSYSKIKPAMSVTIYTFDDSPRINVTVSAVLTGDTLVFSHHVSGDSFHAHSGMSEFTYTAKLEGAAVTRLCDVLGVASADQQGLFQALVARGSQLGSVEEIGKFLRSNGIDYITGDPPEVSWI